jgi:hypothetical protein
MTSAALALREKRPVGGEAVAHVVELTKLEAIEVAPRSAVSTKFALATIALVEAAWLATLGYFALSILH